jgi:hypothetical protein
MLTRLAIASETPISLYTVWNGILSHFKKIISCVISRPFM